MHLARMTKKAVKVSSAKSMCLFELYSKVVLGAQPSRLLDKHLSEVGVDVDAQSRFSLASARVLLETWPRISRRIELAAWPASTSRYPQLSILKISGRKVNRERTPLDRRTCGRQHLGRAPHAAADGLAHASTSSGRRAAQGGLQPLLQHLL